MKILRCYPDYGKAPTEYVANLMAVLDRYPVEIIMQLADVRTGLPGKCKFLPVPAEVVEMADGFIAVAAQRAARPDYSSLKRVSMAEYAQMRGSSVLGPFRPFPKLYAAFGDEKLQGLSFDALFDASRTLATQGHQAAADFLDRVRRSRLPPSQASAA